MNPYKPANKTCVACGRTIEWRKKWECDWESVKYCSQRCRRAGVKDVDRELEQAILNLLAARQAGATICPSEAARQVGDSRTVEWQSLMEQTRQAARRLVVAGKIEITQGGRTVDPSTAKGPIRLRRR